MALESAIITVLRPCKEEVDLSTHQALRPAHLTRLSVAMEHGGSGQDQGVSFTTDYDNGLEVSAWFTDNGDHGYGDYEETNVTVRGPGDVIIYTEDEDEEADPGYPIEREAIRILPGFNLAQWCRAALGFVKRHC